MAVETAPQHHAPTSASTTAMSDSKENGSAVMGSELRPTISNSSEFDANTDIVAILGRGDPTSSQPASGAITPASEISQDDADGTRKRSGTVVPLPTVLARSSTPPFNTSGQSLLQPSSASAGIRTTSKYNNHSPIPDTPVNGAVSPADTLEATIAKLQARCADLASQVTSLNGKLVQSYNRVGGLEDDVHTKSTQSATLQKQVEQLEAQRKEWEDKFEGGLLVEKDHVQAELSRMMDQVIKETASRGKAEKDKATIEKELAELSSQLFQEANQMVAAEHVAKVRAERRMQELEQNLKDTEAMMTGQSEQMRGLGGKLEEVEAERDDLKKQLEEANEAASNSSAFSVGSVQTTGSNYPFSPESSFSAMPGTPGGSNRSLQQALMTKHPLQYLALDVQPYFEFVVFTKGMIRIRKNIMERRFSHNESHYASGVSSYASAYGSAAGAGHGAHMMTSPKPSQYQTAMLKQEQNEALSEALPLSQYTTFPFIRRLQDEDTVATLHLEDAPGLSFFSRGKISNAILDGNLAIEPAYISLPSDQCCMCGASLQRFIASHQTTKKEDPRKTLTRLATGWIPGSGTNTPTKSESSGFSIATLTNALEALTPSREISGFNFGIPSGEGKPPVRRQSGGATSSLSAPRGSDRERALAAASANANRPSTSESQGNFPLIAAARQNAQVYLFRTTDSESKYAICPTYCLPRLRAVCDLWTYVRTIQRGLLTEDLPKFVAPPATSEYAQQTRRLSNQMPPPSATTAKGGWQGFASAIATPQINASRQLMLPADAARTNGTQSLSSSVNSGKPPVITEEPIGVEAVTGLGLDIQAKDFASKSPNPSTEGLASTITTAPTSVAGSVSTAPAPAQPNASSENLPGKSAALEAAADESNATSVEPVRRPSIEINTPGGEHVIAPDSEVPPAEGHFKLAWPPARPKRSTARDGASTPSTPVPDHKDGGFFNHAASPKVTQLASAIANAQNQPIQVPGKAAAAASAPTSAVAPPPTPVAAPVSASAAVPPKLPARSSVPHLHSPGALRLPVRPALSKLSTSTSSVPQNILANTPAGAAVSVAQQNWQEKAWFEVVRLKEAAFWTRVGSQHQQH